MKRGNLMLVIMALALTAALGISTLAQAHGPMRGYHGGYHGGYGRGYGGGYGGYPDMTPGQYAAQQEAYAAFDKSIRPLQEQMFTRQAELDALYYGGASSNDPKVQSLQKEISELDAKLYAAHADLRKQMGEKGLPAYGDGMRYGYGCPMWGHGGMAGPGYGRHGGMGHRGYGCGYWR